MPCAGASGSTADSLALHWNPTWRRLDSVLLPTKGYTLSLQTALGRALNSTEENGPFARGYARYTLYQPLGASWYASARVEAGQVFARDAVGIPDTLLFRAGGDDSVRGYAYRSIGVTLPDGQTAAGRYLVVGSLELQRPIIIDGLTSAWDFVAFVDAGGVADKPQQLTAKVGVGAGAQGLAAAEPGQSAQREKAAPRRAWARGQQLRQRLAVAHQQRRGAVAVLHLLRAAGLRAAHVGGDHQRALAARQRGDQQPGRLALAVRLPVAREDDGEEGVLNPAVGVVEPAEQAAIGVVPQRDGAANRAFANRGVRVAQRAGEDGGEQ